MFQGNILNPLLFNFVLLELPNAIPGNLSPSLYSDDICLWTSGLAFGQINDNLYVGIEEWTILPQRKPCFHSGVAVPRIFRAA